MKAKKPTKQPTKQPTKKVEYQIGEEDGEVIRKAVVRHGAYIRQDVAEDIVKRLRTEFHAEFTKQGNFTICVLISDDKVVPGVAKRCPTDAENMAVGNAIALTNAVKKWLAS